jgi:hypothetical protein
MDLWRKYEAITQALSHELCEQLRLVLEPTKKSKLKSVEFFERLFVIFRKACLSLCWDGWNFFFKEYFFSFRGDYRTGKRLNMRKVVAYVASDFRKDKIWLRRTLPSQRQYQVLIAVDDSSSMADNQTKEVRLVIFRIFQDTQSYRFFLFLVGLRVVGGSQQCLDCLGGWRTVHLQFWSGCGTPASFPSAFFKFGWCKSIDQVLFCPKQNQYS